LLNTLSSALSHIGWRTKILVYSALYIVLVLTVGLFSAYTIDQQNHSMADIVQGSQQRVNGAANARVAVVEMGRALANVVAAAEKRKIRIQAIGAIRSLSLLDEQIQTLSKTLLDNEELKEISTIIERMRPVQMQVIKMAKKNKDAEAMKKMASIMEDSQRVDTLSQQLVDKERKNLTTLQEESAKRGAAAINLMLGIISAGVLLGIISSLFIANLLTKPLAMVEASMTSLSEGDLRVNLEPAGSDEIGHTVSAMTRTVSNLHELISKIRGDAGLLSQQSTEVGNTAHVVNSVSTKLHDSVEAIQEDTNTVHSITQSVTEHLEQAASDAQKTVESTQYSAKQLMVSVAEFERFQVHMEETAETTKKLSNAADQVTSITDTISNISSQTNLLALNAAIEAARAGDHGRGFAVVADEVRQLARRTEEATSEISGLVEGISNSVVSTVKALETSVDDAKENIERLTLLAKEANESSTQVEGMRTGMLEVEALMQSQTQSVNNITSAVTQLLEVSGDANIETDKLNKLSQDLDLAATDLNTAVDRFKL
jgi:methyl-accepting chemotaxis protein